MITGAARQPFKARLGIFGTKGSIMPPAKTSLQLHRLWLGTLTLAIALLSQVTLAQVTGFQQDFRSGNIIYWDAYNQQAQPTYQLSADSGTLKITYTRIPSNYVWDNIHFKPPSVVDMTSNPLITIRIQSTVNTVLSVKPIWQDATNSWIDYSLIGDAACRTISLRIAGSGNRRLTEIYFYLDGGTTVSKSGVVRISDFRLGDSAFVAFDVSGLERAVTATQRLLMSAQEGASEGQFPIGSKALLQAALSQAIGVINGGTKNQAVVEQAEWDLYDACATLERQVKAVRLAVVDTTATKETRYLYMNLARLAPYSLLFGMHDATGYGVGWSGDDDRSDVKSVSGDYPAVFSEDINKVELNSEIDRMRYRLTTAYDRGSVITLSWHQYDPNGRGFYNTDVNNERIVSTIIPGGARHQDYKNKLKKMALFLKSLRGAHGESIPVIFRPYHEHVGNWFWWGPAYTTTQEYNAIWQFTAKYLRDSLNVHNLLWALSPSLDLVGTGTKYFNIYPGDSYVDIFGADYYFSSPLYESEIQNFSRYMRTMVSGALNRSKLTAMTEVGQELLPTSDWFTRGLLSPIKNDSINTNIAYAAVWRNASTTHFFAPYPGHSSVPDFLQFYSDPYVLFQSKLPPMYQRPLPDTLPPVILTRFDSVYVSPTTLMILTLSTNERAYVRYGFADAPFQSLPYPFQMGEGGYVHQTAIALQQGMSGTIYARAKDVSGNAMTQSTVIRYQVDTLEGPIAWFDPRYPLLSWNKGTAPIGTAADDSTHSQAVRTVYFKKQLTLAQLPTAAAVFVKGNGGAAVYVNNREVGRVNLPTGVALEYTTDPIVTAPFNKWFTLDSVALRTLRSGENNIAVEIHAASQASVQGFDARIIDQSYASLLPLNSQWYYFDKGYKPRDVKLRDIMSGVDDQTNIPRTIELYANYPNPFNPTTSIRYDLSRGMNVKLEVYDILGRRVAVLADQYEFAGTHVVQFNGSMLASGVYLLRLQAGEFHKVQKMVLIK